ncbi:hypothetical protein AX17_005134 [Amanita inopinata Kibby_2008]|nr:hypothetical protein AX17_005134 [Amanita inopinata Kibby_2008]
MRERASQSPTKELTENKLYSMESEPTNNTSATTSRLDAESVRDGFGGMVGPSPSCLQAGSINRANSAGYRATYPWALLNNEQGVPHVNLAQPRGEHEYSDSAGTEDSATEALFIPFDWESITSMDSSEENPYSEDLTGRRELRKLR